MLGTSVSEKLILVCLPHNFAATAASSSKAALASVRVRVCRTANELGAGRPNVARHAASTAMRMALVLALVLFLVILFARCDIFLIILLAKCNLFLIFMFARCVIFSL